MCICDNNIIAVRDREDKMANGVDIDLILRDTILIALLADGSNDGIDCRLGRDTRKSGESKLAHYSEVKN